jgi:ubiquinone/menaquinone biosynthesis C-methylase UbiE
MSTPGNDDTYVLGRSEEEAARLQRQAGSLAGYTRQLLEAAGIGPGMHVLDLGSGAGDVAMLAAALVGPTGYVTGVDMNAAILEQARVRAQAAGHTNLTFVAGDLREVPLETPVDAVVGRLILGHLREPAAVLRQLLPSLRSGGVMAFLEWDGTQPDRAWPPVPLLAQVTSWATRAVDFGGADSAMGLKLHRVLLDAGLPAPQLHAFMEIGGDRAYIEGMANRRADFVRSLLPLIIQGGIATEEEVGIETLAARLQDAVVPHQGIICGPLLIGAWARKSCDEADGTR